MTVFVILGILSLFFGIMFLFFPNKMKELSASFNKVIISADESLFKMRVGIGICLMAIGIVCFFLLYYFTRK